MGRRQEGRTRRTAVLALAVSHGHALARHVEGHAAARVAFAAHEVGLARGRCMATNAAGGEPPRMNFESQNGMKKNDSRAAPPAAAPAPAAGATTRVRSVIADLHCEPDAKRRVRAEAAEGCN